MYHAIAVSRDYFVYYNTSGGHSETLKYNHTPDYLRGLSATLEDLRQNDGDTLTLISLPRLGDQIFVSVMSFCAI